MPWSWRSVSTVVDTIPLAANKSRSGVKEVVPPRVRRASRPEARVPTACQGRAVHNVLGIAVIAYPPCSPHKWHSTTHGLRGPMMADGTLLVVTDGPPAMPPVAESSLPVRLQILPLIGSLPLEVCLPLSRDGLFMMLIVRL